MAPVKNVIQGAVNIVYSIGVFVAILMGITCTIAVLLFGPFIAALVLLFIVIYITVKESRTKSN